VKILAVILSTVAVISVTGMDVAHGSCEKKAKSAEGHLKAAL
jgi:hypothetical protein